MTKYHINPETGNPNKCVAKPGNCRFGSDTTHYASKDEARAAYEAEMSGGTVAESAKRKSDAHEDEYHEEVELRSRVDHDFPAQYLPDYIAAIEKANRRLEKYGVEERFEYEVKHYNKPTEKVGGMILSEDRVSLTLNSPSISHDGNTFLAVIEKEEAGFITKTGRDVELSGWRPDSMKCEHCGQNRPRAKTYLIEGPDGVRRQIGSTCVDAYLGVKVEGLWAIGEDPTANIQTGGSHSPNPAYMARETKHMIAYALAVSDNGENFVSRSASGFMAATADEIERALWDNRKEDAEWRAEMERKANEYLANGRAEEVLNEIKSIQGDGDYATNLRTVASGEYIKPSNASLLVSGLSVYRRNREKAARESQAPAAPGFVGEPKAKIAGIKAKVTNLFNTWGTDYVTGQAVQRTKVTFRDENNHEIVWWASKVIDDVEEGQEIEFKGGSVKKHDNFRGTDQTVVTRVKF